MSHYTMLYKNGKRACNFLVRFYFDFILVLYILGAFFNKTVIPLVLAEYEMVQ